MAAAPALGVQLQVVEVRDAGDYERAFATMVNERAGALFVPSNPIFNRDRRKLIELAGAHRLPAIYEGKNTAEAGGLLAYGPDPGELYRRNMAYVDRILKGARPAELPVECPAKFELSINLKTARQLGLTIPESLRRRADHVVQ